MKLDKIQVSGKKIPKSFCQMLLNSELVRHMLALPWIVWFIISLAHKSKTWPVLLRAGTGCPQYRKANHFWWLKFISVQCQKWCALWAAGYALQRLDWGSQAVQWANFLYESWFIFWALQKPQSTAYNQCNFTLISSKKLWGVLLEYREQ